MTDKTTELTQDDSQLIEETLDWHHQAIDHARQMLICVKNAGDKLNELASRHSRGWGDWSSENLPGLKASSIRVYRRVADNWQWLEPLVEANSNMTLADARRAITDKNKREQEDLEDHESLDRVNRKRFLEQLEYACAGLSPREIIEQSNCFIFKDGRILTYNDEITCSIECSLPIEAVVDGPSLLRLLKLMDETYIKIEVDDSVLVVTGHRNEACITLEQKIYLPISDVPEPEHWELLSDDFREAVETVAPCASTDETQFTLTCIHFTPTHIEASDIYGQLVRYWIETGIKQPMLIRADSLILIAKHDMTEFCITPEWIHFQNDEGIRMSCRDSTAYTSQYPNVDKLLELEGTPLTLPEGLRKAIARTGIFSASNADNDHVLIDLTGKTMKVSGDGAYGHYEEKLELDDPAPDVSFRVSPKLIDQFAKKYESCEVSPIQLKVDAGAFVYLACLDAPDDDD